MYLKTFEKVRCANRWDNGVAISALYNSFINTKVGTFLDSMPDEVIKAEILRSFGLTVYDYLEKFRYSRQSSETVSQFSVFVTENISKVCNMLDVGFGLR